MKLVWKTFPLAGLISLVLASIACGSAPEDQIQPAHVLPPVGDVVPRGERILAIDINEAGDRDYDRAFAAALEVGAGAVSLSMPWDTIERSPEVYAPEPNFLAIADLYYPPNEIPVSLMIGPIDTNNLRVPNDLVSTSFDDPRMIERFSRLLDYVFSQIPHTKITVLAIGNEIDASLLGDEQACRAYEVFFERTAAHARSIRPGIQVGTKVMLEGLLQDRNGCLAGINQYSDIVLTTYYPLGNDFSVLDPSIVHEKFTSLIQRYPDKPIYFLELGYPSSSQLGSSLERQVVFIQNAFQAWDRYADQIRLISFTWMHDIDDQTLDSYLDYYGIYTENFAAYLSSLGLKTYDGQDKPAFEALRQEAAARGW